LSPDTDSSYFKQSERIETHQPTDFLSPKCHPLICSLPSKSKIPAGCLSPDTDDTNSRFYYG
jgi:hypothetical protein